MCNQLNTVKYWQCPKCTFINDAEMKDCSMCAKNTAATPNQSVSPLSNMGLFVSFNKHKNRTIIVTLSRNNPLQRKHFDHFGEVLDDLYSSALFINAAFMEKQLDSNKLVFATTFIDVIQELTAYLRRNNDEILEEIKMAIELQTYQPNGAIAVVPPIWDHLNQCVKGLFEEANEFLELRDQFVLILMDIMWKSHRLNIRNSVLEKLKKNIKNDEELKMNDDEIENKVFRELNAIRRLLPGQEQFKSVLRNLPIKSAEVNESVRKLNEKVNEHKRIFEQRKQQIESKKAQLSTKKRVLDAEQKKFERVNDGSNYNLAKTLSDKCNNLVVEHNKLVGIIDADISNLNKFSDNFQKTKQPFVDAYDLKRAEYDQLVLELESIRSVLGIKGDNLISEFLEQMNGFTPLSMRICSRIIQFEMMISTLSELLIRGIDDNEENNSPKIEWYFVQPQIRLNDFVKPLKEKQIITIDDFRNAYKGKIAQFNSELLPYLKRKINRRIKLAEKRKLRTICQAKG